jgi:hypothetical protein
MVIKHTDLEIPPKTPFSNCRLQREKYAVTLTKIVDTYSDGFSLAINNDWGGGKTTFVKMWKQLLENEGHLTLYFNAWENDFDDDPMIALLSELNAIVPLEKKDVFKKIVKQGALVSKALFPAIASAFIKKYVDSEKLQAILEKSSEAVINVFEDEVESYTRKKQSLLDFRSDLEKFVREYTAEKPLVFFVDEIDRCRPDYAVRILEHIKHFFSVKGIVFVLAIDKRQLENAIRGFYGSESIDAPNYLRRFIDLEFSIPDPSIKLFCEYLYGYFQFADYLEHKDRTQHRQLAEDSYLFIRFAELMFDSVRLPLRQIEKIYAHARIAMNLFPYNNYLLPQLFLMLVYMKDVNLEFYVKLGQKKVSLQEISEELRRVFPNLPPVDKIRSFQNVEVLLLHAYRESIQNPNHRENFSLSDVEGHERPTFSPRFFRENEADQFIIAVKKLEKDFDLADLRIDHILDKINLTGNFTS